MPLVDSTTGIPIPIFPQESQAIGQMNSKLASPITHYYYLIKYKVHQCRTILQQLGQVVLPNQDVAIMRRQVRIHTGLPADQFNVV